MEELNIIKKSIVIVDFCQSPIIEVAGEVVFKISNQDIKSDVLLIDDYCISDGSIKRLPMFFKWFDIPLSFKRIFLRNCPYEVKFYNKVVTKNVPLKDWPSILKENYKKIQKNKNNNINSYLKNIQLNNVDIGNGILSSIISNSRDNKPCYHLYKNQIDNAFNEFVRKYNVYIQFFKINTSYDSFFICNGRFTANKALIAALSFLKIKKNIFYYERSSTNIDAFTIRRFMPHDRYKIYAEIIKTWENSSSLQEARLIGKTYFLQRTHGQGLSWYSYTKGINDCSSKAIIKSILGEKKKNSKNIIFCTSSEDEFESLGNVWFKSDSYLNQLEIIEHLSNFAYFNNHKLFIRVHPNFKSSSEVVKERWSKFFKNIKSTNTIIISHESSVSSYALIENMDLVIVYGSSIGIESAFLGKEVIVTGPSYYANINAKISSAYTLDELSKLLHEKTSKDYQTNSSIISDSTLPYGFWCYKNGYKFKNYVPISPLDGKYYGRDVDGIFSFLIKLKKFFNLFKK